MNTHIRIATVGRDLGIQIYEQEMREHQTQVKEVASEKIATVGDSKDFLKDALSLFDLPSSPKPNSKP